MEPFICGFERGEARRPPNRFDLRIWSTPPGMVRLEPDAVPARVFVPNVPGAFLVHNVLSVVDCERLAQVRARRDVTPAAG